MKKLFYLTIILVLLSTIKLQAQVSINTDGSSPNIHAMLDVKSSDKGVLIPRMTTSQRTTFGNALGTADAGMMVYDTDIKVIYVFNGTSWVAATSYWYRNNNYVFNTTDSIGIATSTPGSELDVHGHIWQTGTGNSVFLGEGAGENDDFSNNANVFIGKSAGNTNTIGSENIAIGNRALFKSTENSNMIAIGDSALFHMDSVVINGNTSFGKKTIAIGNKVLKNQGAGGLSTVIGHNALENGSVYNSIVIGDSTLYSGHADSSVVIGNKALFNNIHNEYYPHASVIIGDRAMYNFGNWASGGTSSDFSQNIVIGTRAFYDLTWGEHNVALGRHVGEGITLARDNVVIGDEAMSYAGTPSSSEPRYNVCIGNYSGRSTTDNMYNTSIGHGAGIRVKYNNVAVGYGALGGGSTNLKENNIAVGASALYSSETNNNIGIGYQALQNNANGSQNLALGYRAGVNSSGSNNIFIGIQAGQDESGSNQLIIGNTNPIIRGDLSTGQMTFLGQIKVTGGNPAAGKVLTSDAYGLATWETPDPAGAYEIDDLTDAKYNGSSLFLGHGAGAHDNNSNDNTAVGEYALWTNVSGTQNVAIGKNAGYSSTGNGNVFIGYNAGREETGNNKLYIANSHTATPLIGGDFYTSQVDINGTLKITGGSPGSGKVLTSDANGLASWQDAVGAIGDLSDAKTTTGSCVFLGLNAGASITTGTANTALGYDALNAVADGSQNTALGYHALKNNVSGSGNTATGYNAISNTNGSNNTSMGYFAGYQNSTGSGNVFLGYQAGYSETGSNKLYIANSNTTTPLIGGDFSTGQVDINGTIKITGGNPGNGRVLTSDANGLASWGTAPISADGSIDTHSDVDVSTTAPTSGQVLSWDGTNWIPADDANTTYTAGTGLALNGTVFSLNSGIDNLTDVDVSTNSPTNGQVLSWDGTNWVPANTSGGVQAINDLNDGINDSSSLFLGTYAGINDDATSNLNIGVGTSALRSNTTGSENTVIGAEALYNNISGNYNTAVGRGAGLHSTGSGNVFIGYRAGNSETGDNKLYIANSATTSPLIGGDFSAAQVYINGTIKITGGNPGAGKVLTSDASGLASWQNVSGAGAQEINDLSDGLTAGNSVFLGGGSGSNNGSSSGNTGTGNLALNSNSSGTNNSAFGAGALATISSGDNNTGIGYLAGVYDASNNPLSSVSNSIFIGTLSKAAASGDDNEIVIGNNISGLGSNTILIGNSSILKTALTGKVGIGVTDPKSALQVNGGVQVANDTDTATADKVGTIRYREDANNSYVEMCVRTGASSYAWIIIHQETW